VPHHITIAGAKKPFAIAGVWETFRTKDGEIIETAAVVTRPARGGIAALHDRMPLVLAEEQYEAWLTGGAAEAQRIAASETAPELAIAAVSTWVNDVRHDDPKCVEPAGDAPPLGQIALRF
jgi:putative SOS response-associated peptidase YedK